MSWETLRKNLYNHKICDCTLRRFSPNMCLNHGVVKIKMGLMAKPDGISQGSHIYTIYWIHFFTLPFSFHIRIFISVSFSSFILHFIIYISPFTLKLKLYQITPPPQCFIKTWFCIYSKKNFSLIEGLFFSSRTNEGWWEVFSKNKFDNHHLKALLVISHLISEIPDLKVKGTVHVISRHPPFTE